MIIDSHVHTFPYMGGPSGFSAAEEHLRYIQRGLYFAINPARRQRDNAPIKEQTLWDGVNPGPEGLRDVGLRMGKFGRVEWRAGGEDLYLQYFAPSLADQVSSPEYIVAEMDYAGVDLAVLQNASIYGLLNDYFAACIQQYPTRFVGLAQVREAQAHTDEQLAELRRCAETLGLKGLYYHLAGFWPAGYRDSLDDAQYDVFWAEVERLGLVVFWDPAGSPFPSAEAYTGQLERIRRVLERHPGLRSLLVQALPLGYYAPAGRYELPDIVYELGNHDGFLFEIAYPISYGRDWEYPYAETWPLIQQLYDALGPHKLVWGSDMPNVLRFCTYRQSYAYLRHCTCFAPGELDLVLGQNIARLLGLPAGGSDSRLTT